MVSAARQPLDPGKKWRRLSNFLLSTLFSLLLFLSRIISSISDHLLIVQSVLCCTLFKIKKNM